MLGEQPTSLQKIVIWLMTASLAVWPLASFTSIFLFDAPIRSAVDEVSRLGMAFTIWLYPLYLFPLIILWFRLSKRVGEHGSFASAQ